MIRRLEEYDPEALVGDIREHKHLRISLPEAVVRFHALPHLDWSKEVELPPPLDISIEPYLDGIEWRMHDLVDRYRGLVLLTYSLSGRVFYHMLSGSRYEARLEWPADIDHHNAG